ncbi:MAG: universal stress protein [Acidobacteria bacterium]|nr:universal stress protein [Acidobacteriota bacterium]
MKILIGTDGSDFSRAAAEECCKFIADPSNVEIKILSAFEDTYAIAAEPFAISSEYYQELANAVEKQAQNFVADTAKIIREKLKSDSLRISAEVVRGAPDRELVEIAESWGADLIVVGSHGRGFWGRLLGSVSDGVVHHAPCSVLVVRGEKMPARPVAPTG